MSARVVLFSRTLAKSVTKSYSARLTLTTFVEFVSVTVLSYDIVVEWYRCLFHSELKLCVRGL